jgi:helix-turn-helix protein
MANNSDLTVQCRWKFWSLRDARKFVILRPLKEWRFRSSSMRSKESEKVESGQETRKKWRIRERERKLH